MKKNGVCLKISVYAIKSSTVILHHQKQFNQKIITGIRIEQSYNSRIKKLHLA